MFDADDALLPGPVPGHPGDRASAAHPVQEAGGRRGGAEWAVQLRLPVFLLATRVAEGCNVSDLRNFLSFLFGYFTGRTAQPLRAHHFAPGFGRGDTLLTASVSGFRLLQTDSEWAVLVLASVLFEITTDHTHGHG